jgi:hypothetical protein
MFAIFGALEVRDRAQHGQNAVNILPNGFLDDPTTCKVSAETIRWPLMFSSSFAPNYPIAHKIMQMPFHFPNGFPVDLDNGTLHVVAS